MNNLGDYFIVMSVCILIILINIVKNTYIPEMLAEMLKDYMSIERCLKRKDYFGTQRAIKKTDVLDFGCNNISENDVDYVCTHAMMEKKWNCFCDPSVSEAIKFLLHNKTTVCVYESGAVSDCNGSAFYIQRTGKLKNLIKKEISPDLLNKKEFLSLVNRIKNEIEKTE